MPGTEGNEVATPADPADRVQDAPARAPALAWLVFGFGALSFCYGYFHRVAPSAMVADVMRDFAVGAAAVGNLSAFYFYSYTAMQLPVGVMADRFGERRVLAAGAILCAGGSTIFALADTIALAYAGRLLIGVGAACAFVPTLRLAGHWFPPRRFALLSGLTVTIGMAGGVLGQGPLAASVVVFGWRPTLLAAAAFALALAVATWLIVRDRPSIASPSVAGDAATGHRPPPLLSGLRRALANGQTWALCVAGFGLGAPLLGFGALWAVPYMSAAYGLSRPEAAAVASLVLFGWGASAPIQGWLSDRVQRRKLPLAIANAGVLVTFGAVVCWPGMPLWAAQALFLATGFFSSAMVCAFAAAREHNPDSQGAAIAVVNTAIIAAGMILQPLIGLVLDAQWDGALEAGARAYAVGAYRYAFLAILASALAGLVAALALRETYAKPVQPPAEG